MSENDEKEKRTSERLRGKIWVTLKYCGRGRMDLPGESGGWRMWLDPWTDQAEPGWGRERAERPLVRVPQGRRSHQWVKQDIQR